jgi:antitoxin Phd
MKTIWKLQDTKRHFSQVVEDAMWHGPQFVSRRGVNAVVILSTAEYQVSPPGVNWC